MIPKVMYRKKVYCWHFVDWYCISLGLTLDFHSPNIEIHLPFGFFRIGYEKRYREYIPTFEESMLEDLCKRVQRIEKYISHEIIEKEIN